MDPVLGPQGRCDSTPEGTSGSDTEQLLPGLLQLGAWMAHWPPPAGTRSLPTPQLCLQSSHSFTTNQNRTISKTKVVPEPRLTWVLAVHTHGEKVRGEGQRPPHRGAGLEGAHTHRGPTWGLESQPCQSPGSGAQPGSGSSEPLRSPAWRSVAESGEARVGTAVGPWRHSG